MLYHKGLGPISSLFAIFLEHLNKGGNLFKEISKEKNKKSSFPKVDVPSLARSKEAAIDTVYIGAPASEYTLQDPTYLPLTSEVKQTDALGCEAIGLTSYRKNV